MQVEIREVGQGDAALFERVAEAVFDEPVDIGRLTAYLAAPGHHMIVALHDGWIVGQTAAVVHRHPDKVTELYIDEVGVSPAFQRHGIARAMLDRMFAIGKSLGCEEADSTFRSRAILGRRMARERKVLEVGTEPDNWPARALYAERGGPPAESFVMYVVAL